MGERVCQQDQCSAPAACTLTYDYEGKVVAIGPLAPSDAFQGMHMCTKHATQFREPRGWHILRHVDLAGHERS